MNKETKKELSVLADKIIKWADEKGILEKATPEKQLLKVIEEHGELARAILKKDVPEFVDAVGDCFVTIVIHAELCFEKINYDNLDNILNRDLAHIRHSESIIHSVHLTSKQFHLQAVQMLYTTYLNNLNMVCGISFINCVESAYNVIAGRTGEMRNGTFVKDA